CGGGGRAGGRGRGGRVGRLVRERADVALGDRGSRTGEAALVGGGRRTVRPPLVERRASREERLRERGTAVVCERSDRGVGVDDVSGPLAEVVCAGGSGGAGRGVWP